MDLIENWGREDITARILVWIPESCSNLTIALKASDETILTAMVKTKLADERNGS